MAKKLTIEQMQEIAKSHGGKCLSKKYINSRTKLELECKEGHRWFARKDSVKRGSWCPKCSGKAKLTIEEMQEIALSRGGKCLSKEYFTGKTKMKWRCKEGHEWEIAPSSVKRGSWCLKCARTARKLTIEQMQEIVLSRGGKCISKEYVNSITKLEWECKEGHRWFAVPSSVKSGSWCPKCSEGISERITRKYFEMLFGAKFEKRKPKWNKSGRKNKLTGNNVRLELDGYNKELKIAFEYHGVQHYKFISGWVHKTVAQFEKLQKDDEKVIKNCLKNNVNLIIVPYWIEYTNMEEYIEKEADKLGLTVKSFDKKLDHKEWDIYSKNIINLMQEIAKSQGGKCLSKKYINTNSKLEWECSESHRWFAVPRHVKRGSWCPYCVGKHITIEEIQEIALSRGGWCLSKRYINKNTKLKWKCKEGHIWKATPDSVKNQSSWCPYCAKNAKLTIEEMQELAKSRGGKCLSKVYLGFHTKLKWECSESHRWFAVPSSVKSGSWCLKCYNLSRTKKF
jgi:hypothetical protein